MFNHLIESNKTTNKKGAFGLGFVSLVGHSVIVLGAVVATLTAGQKKDDQTIDTAMVFLNQEEQKKPEEQPPIVDVPQLKGFQTVVAPTDIPTNIPPINLQEHFDPKDYSGTGVEGGIGTGIVPRGVVGAGAELSGPAAPGGRAGPGAGAGDHRYVGPCRAAVGEGDSESQPRLRPTGQELRAAGAVPSRARPRAGGARAGEPADRLQDQEIGRPNELR